MAYNGWIGVDFDGTLSHYEAGTHHQYKFGKVIEPMKARVLDWIEQGFEVRIVTARVSLPDALVNQEVARSIQGWLVENGMPPLAITNEKDYGMLELYDDRAVQVEMNTGRLIGRSTRF